MPLVELLSGALLMFSDKSFSVGESHLDANAQSSITKSKILKIQQSRSGQSHGRHHKRNEKEDVVSLYDLSMTFLCETTYLCIPHHVFRSTLRDFGESAIGA